MSDSGPAWLPLNWPPTVRQWLYNVATAALGVTAGYGLMTGRLALLWLLAVAALLGLASAKVPDAPDWHPGDNPPT